VIRIRLGVLWRARRVLIPLGVVALLLLTTLVAHAIDTPDTGDDDFLSPTSTAGIGSARLADELRARGVTVVRHTDPDAALLDAAGATLFVPAAEFLDPLSTSLLAMLPLSTRVVLVDPPPRALDLAGVPLLRADRRWATAAVPPDACPVVPDAGAAAARRQRYVPDPSWRGTAESCYAGGLARVTRGQEMIVIGASDPFRNDRLDEHDNRRLATGLLGTRPRLVWLDIHERVEREPFERPTVTYSPDQDSADGWSDGDPGRGRGEGGDPGQRSDGSSGRRDSPLADAFPPWLWAMLAVLAAAALLLLLWAGRRLGPAVSEPLPVEVRSGETVLGRGRLYQRAKARGPAAEVLRASALARIGPALGLRPDPDPAEVVARTAERTGRGHHEVDALLHGPEPADDTELVALARQLNALTAAVTGLTPPGPPGVPGPRIPPGGADGAAAFHEGGPR